MKRASGWGLMGLVVVCFSYQAAVGCEGVYRARSSTVVTSVERVVPAPRTLSLHLRLGELRHRAADVYRVRQQETYRAHYRTEEICEPECAREKTEVISPMRRRFELKLETAVE